MARSKTQDLTIIGIGSSAGGLEAIQELVATLPEQIAATYVIVQHMSPHHKSLMTELVARQTELRVADIVDGIKPEPNVIYITPPKTDVILSDRRLHLVAASERPAAPKPSVDRFLVSLAEEIGDKSVGIILSGTGSDGAYGIRAIREAGGITMAQEATSAKYDGMPLSAIQTDCVDIVLRPDDMGTHLEKILALPRDFSAFQTARDDSDESPLDDILQILLARTRIDFRDYKQTTISRRIERRMVTLGIDDQDEYAQLLRTTPATVDALFKDLLISVTRFFRDKSEFDKLAKLLPEIIEKVETGPIRVWIPGCATGEEAYTVAMLLSEALGAPDAGFKQRVQIFATDIDKNALQIARQGIYSNAALNYVPENLAAKYLVRQGDQVRVVDSLRAAILFSDHNVCQDPPFQNIHLLCCRNLLIYFNTTLQRKVLSRFHYSLADGGLLFLGTAESITGSDEMFSAAAPDHRVFRKCNFKKENRPYEMPNISTVQHQMRPKKHTPEADNIDRQFFDALVQSLGEDSILVTENFSIIRVIGSVSQHIDITEKTRLGMHLDLLKSPMREEARSLVTIALKNNRVRSGIRHTGAIAADVDLQLQVYPIVAPKINEKLALIVFTKVERRSPRVTPDANEALPHEAARARVAELESEVAKAREYWQQTIEELETSNEELQSLNEELQSTNEELQATNEELETSNEELQSTNEELITVNEELQITASELSGRTGELASVIQSTPLAILVLDSALQITQATDKAAELFDIKRPIAHPHISQCSLPDGFPRLGIVCTETLRLGETTVHEFTSGDSRILLSCSPYFDVHGKILGLTLVITEFPGLASEMEMILNHSNLYMIHRTQEGRVLRISRALADLLDVNADEVVGELAYDLLQTKDAEGMRQLDDDISHSPDGYKKVTIPFTHGRTGETVWLAMERYRHQSAADEHPTYYSLASNVTDIVNAFDKTEALLEKFRHVQNIAGHGYWELDPISEQIYWSSKVFALHGVDEADGVPALQDAIHFYHPQDIPMVEAAISAALGKAGEFVFQARLIQKSGTEITVESRGYCIKDAHGQTLKLVGTFKQV